MTHSEITVDAAQTYINTVIAEEDGRASVNNAINCLSKAQLAHTNTFLFNPEAIKAEWRVWCELTQYTGKVIVSAPRYYITRKRMEQLSGEQAEGDLLDLAQQIVDNGI